MASGARLLAAGDATTEVVDELLVPVLVAFETQRPGESTDLIVAAAHEAARAHEGQLRRSGEPYVSHPVAVAGIVAELGLDAPTVAAALLHDAAEDTGLSVELIGSRLDEQVAAVVDGVTKLDRLAFDSKEAQQAATIRKMLIAMASDWRVLLIKLADRLHNMRTIAVMPEAKQRRTAQETMDVYAPLAHRLGVQQVKWQLEDLAFATLHPKRYAEIEQMVAARSPEREKLVGQIISELKARLGDMGIEAEVRGRGKHLWSIYEKMVVQGKEFDEIFDLLGLRIIVANEQECWEALGAVHALWHPVQGRFKDYINTPKFNLYQSLHTTVVGPAGRPVEVQVRTWEMHARAEFGIAAHWSYKEGQGSQGELAWMQAALEADAEFTDPIAFLEALKLDLEQDELYVFTPKGRVIALGERSTAVDFAYAVHTEVGHRCIGAKVNGRLVPLETQLSSADTVEILTSKAEGAGPSQDWLSFVTSSRARTKIRQWFTRERREDAIDQGRDELAKELRRASMPVAATLGGTALSEVAADLGHEEIDSLFAAVGEGQLSAQSVVQRLERVLRGGEEEQVPTTATRAPRSSRVGGREAGIYVEGLDDVMIHLARCCTPVPGDEIIGFVTMGRGVSVHRTDCSNAAGLAINSKERLIEVEWDATSSGVYRVNIEVLAFDRARLLSDVTQAVSEHKLSIVSARTQTTADRVARMDFEIELADPTTLGGLLAALKRVDGVFDAYRQLPGARG